jgi:hypothetical protein
LWKGAPPPILVSAAFHARGAGSSAAIPPNPIGLETGLPLVAGSADSSRKHLLVVPIPFALEPVLRIILSLEAQELSELWIARLDLLPCRIAVVGEVIAAVPADGQVDESPEGVRGALLPFRAMLRVKVEDYTHIRHFFR